MRMLIVLALAAGMTFLAGCNTMQGLGRDIETLGDKIQKKAQ
jgi:predicted small secreted protein